MDDANKPNFAAWSHENLANIATDMYQKLREQDEYIQHLQNDLKDAIAAYRKLITNG